MIVFIATSVRFYSQYDEMAFFEWLEKISSVKSFEGQGNQLFIDFSDDASEDDQREIIALFYRFGIEMTQLLQLKTSENVEWFANSINYWHPLVFK